MLKKFNLPSIVKYTTGTIVGGVTSYATTKIISTIVDFDELEPQEKAPMYAGSAMIGVVAGAAAANYTDQLFDDVTTLLSKEAKSPEDPIVIDHEQ